MKLNRNRIILSLFCGATIALGIGYGAGQNLFTILGVRRVLLISIDGMHSLDLALYVKSHPTSTLASLVASGTNYTNAYTTKPSDSIPATAAYVTGGTPAVTGMYYDDAFNRAWSPAGSACATIGTVIDLKQGYDFFPNAQESGGINPALLPLDPSKGCTPVYPHNMIRVNTIFEVVRNAGLRTAYSEKRPAYDFLNGPSGAGVQDLYVPEINANATLTDNQKTRDFDDLRVASIINQIDGFDHTGTIPTPVPALFGMNFQSVNAGKKNAPSGYSDSFSTPTTGPVSLGAQLDYVDGALARIVAELKAKNLFNTTAIVLTAKHAETALDPNHRQIVVGAGSNPFWVSNLLSSVEVTAAKITFKANIYIWLKAADQAKTASIVSVLTQPANQTALGIGQVLSGDSLKLLFPDPLTDPAVPDIVVIGNIGVNYEPSPTSTVLAEHGGMTENDTHVPLVVSVPGFRAITVGAPVFTTQIAPSILTLLKLNPLALQAVVAEETPLLPNLFL